MNRFNVKIIFASLNRFEVSERVLSNKGYRNFFPVEKSAEYKTTIKVRGWTKKSWKEERRQWFFSPYTELCRHVLNKIYRFSSFERSVCMNFMYIYSVSHIKNTNFNFVNECFIWLLFEEHWMERMKSTWNLPHARTNFYRLNFSSLTAQRLSLSICQYNFQFPIGTSFDL